jgi:hypothetical protein
MTSVLAYTVPDTLVGLLILAAALIALWIIISIPVYIAGKLVTEGKGSFGDAMAATLGGAFAYVLVLYGGTILLSLILAPGLALGLSFLLALIVWVAVYSAAFDTGFLEGIAIALVGWGVLVLLDFFLINAFGVAIPKFYPF